MLDTVGVKVREKIKGSGIWWIFVWYGYQRTSFRVGDKEKAEFEADNIKRELRTGAFKFERQKFVQSPLLKDYFRKFYQEHVKLTLSPASQQSYKANFENHILPVLGSLRLNKINKGKIRKLVAELLSKRHKKGKQNIEHSLSKDSIRIILANLSRLFNHAIEDEIISVNPATNAGKLFRKAPVKCGEIKPLTATQVIKFLHVISIDYSEYYPIFLTAIHTGLREGEIAGLQWIDIDFKAKMIIVRRSFSHGRLGETKTREIRRVDMSDAVTSALKSLERKSEFVFPNKAGKPQDIRNLARRSFRSALKKAELPQIRFHDLRHTYASLLIANNESLKYIQEQMGHTSIRVTSDIYGHLVPGANRQAVNKLPAISSSKRLRLVKK